MRFVVCFERATAEFELGRDPQLMLSQGGQSAAVEVEPITGYDAEIRHLIRCIAEGSSDAGVSCDDAAESLALLEAERRSLETGGPVAFPGEQ